MTTNSVARVDAMGPGAEPSSSSSPSTAAAAAAAAARTRAEATPAPATTTTTAVAAAARPARRRAPGTDVPAAESARRAAAALRASLRGLQRDVACSFRLCGRDFGILGAELLGALGAKAERENRTRRALAHERLERQRAERRRAELEGPIRVWARVRPLPGPEEPRRKVLAPSDKDVQVFSAADGALRKSFTLDRVWGEDATQSALFRELAPLITAATDGRHATILAYGQTGAGKSHTIVGSPADPGLAPRSAALVFERLAEQRGLFDIAVTLQMVEIYNEEMYDLLGDDGGGDPADSDSSGNSGPHSNHPDTGGVFAPFQSAHGHGGPHFVSRRPLGEIRHGERGVYLRNVAAIAVQSPEDVRAATARGLAHRAVHGDAPEARAHASRSHCVWLLDIQRRSLVDGDVDTGRLVLVDLAGSERLVRPDTTGGPPLREAQHINKSLAALADVLGARLAKEKHVPYRNSKLTHLLQDSLGAPDAHTLVLVHLSPGADDVTETVNTLKFASRVSHLENAKTHRGERLEINRLQGLLASQAAQLQNLQERLAAELELRRKYEKRLEEYRQEDLRRRTKEDDRGPRQGTPAKQPPSTPAKAAGAAMLTTTSSAFPLAAAAATPEQVPTNARRWSLYSRRDLLKRSGGTPSQLGLPGQENIAENILRSRSPALRTLAAIPEKRSNAFGTGHHRTPTRARRLSLMSQDLLRKPAFSPLRPAPSTSKRKTATPLEVRSILKKQRLGVAQRDVSSRAESTASIQGGKQVSFVLDESSSLSPPNGGGALTALPPRQPSSFSRIPTNASRVPAPPSRIRAAPPIAMGSPASRVKFAMRSPSHQKPKWNGGWR